MESQLVAKATSGDNDALASLIASVGPMLRARIAPKIDPKFRSACGVDDILQVTYMEAFLRIRQFENRGDGAFLGWMVTLANHNLQDAIRGLTRKKRPPRGRQVGAGDPASDPYVSLLEALPSPATSPTLHARRKEVHSCIDDALLQLPPDYAKVVRRYDLDECPIEEVAKELGRSPGAVYMLRARAHDRLQELLGASTNFFTVGS